MSTAQVAATLEVVDHEDPLPQYFMEGARLGPISIGRHGAFRIDHESVLPLHGYVSFDGSVVYICSFDPRYPILVNGQPVRAGCWTPLEMHCQIQIGAVVARLHRHRHSMITAAPESASSERTRIVRPAAPPSERTRIDRVASTTMSPPRKVRATPTSFDPEVTRFDIPSLTVAIGAKESSSLVRIEPPSAHSAKTSSLGLPLPRKRYWVAKLTATIAASILLAVALAAGGSMLMKRQVVSRAPVPVPSPVEPMIAAPAASSEQEEEPLGTVVLTSPAMDRATTTPSQERAAADALRRGDRQAALALYTKLAKEHSSHPAFGRIARVID